MFCDIVFSHENEKLMGWLEGLEETCKKRIFQNRTKWFENDLEEHDIENYLTSPYKIIKSGKQYVMRVNVPMLMDKCELKIYDENEMEVHYEDLKENTNVVVILEFKGIRCSVRSFQFEIELKQMLVVAPVKLFEKCVIHVDKQNAKLQSNSVPIIQQQTLDTQHLEVGNKMNMNPIVAKDETIYQTQHLDNTESVESKEVQSLTNTGFVPVQPDVSVTMNNENDRTRQSDTIQEIVEVDDFELDDVEKVDTVQLRKRDDVYYKMYKDAKKKAKEAKILALSNYLEAKRIKSTFLLNDEISDDDDNLEEEMKQLSSQL